MTRPGAIVTERDRSILRSLADFRLLTTEQLQRLHFPSTQTALRRVRRLEEAGLVQRRRCDALPTQIVSLTPLGVATLAASAPAGLELPVVTRRPTPLPGAYFLRHQVEVNDFRIGLALAVQRRREIELLGVLADTDRSASAFGTQPRALLSETVTGGGERISHTPDLAFGLCRGERQALFLVEIDRGTEVVGDPRRGVGLFVRFYLRGLVAGAFERLRMRLGLPAALRGFRVLVVTTSPARVEAIRARWGAMPTEQEMAKRFIWLSTWEALGSHDLLDHGWVSLDPGDDTRYVVVPPREAD